MSVYPAALPTVRPAVRSAFEQGSGGGAASIIASLFAAGQQGFWLPFTDFASLTQDSAGTLPYTALEQPVGRVLDRSGRGNHASQVTSTARGVVSARVNLLQKSEDFNNAPWSNQRVNVISDFALAPNGTMTADKLCGNGETDQHRLDQSVTAVAGDYEFMVVARADDVDFVILRVGLAGGSVSFDVRSGLVSGSAIGVAPSITPLSNGFYLCKIAVAGAVANPVLRINISRTAVLESAIGATEGVIIWGASYRQASQASLPYQRVNTPTDYDSVGFPKYARLDGTDDFYTCGGGGSTTGFYYSDVIRPMGGAGTRRVIWSDRSGNNGYELAINTSDKLEFSAGNGTAITTVASTVSAAVAEGKQYEVMDDGAVLSVQIDGSAPVTIARPVVTAGSSTITLYRGASTGYFNGQITEPIYRAGPPPSAYERGVIRTYQMQEAGML